MRGYYIPHMDNLDKSLRILGYYHSALRNIGLYTSLSFAALVYSRYHRSKNLAVNVVMIFVSIFFTLLSLCIALFLREDLDKINEKEGLEALEKWLLLPDIMQYVNGCILLTSLFVLFLQFR